MRIILLRGYPLILSHLPRSVEEVFYHSYYRTVRDGLTELGHDARLSHISIARGEFWRNIGALKAEVDRVGRGEPVFLVAHSMGGLPALRLLVDRGYNGAVGGTALVASPMRQIAHRPVSRLLAHVLRYRTGISTQPLLEFETDVLTHSRKILTISSDADYWAPPMHCRIGGEAEDVNVSEEAGIAVGHRELMHHPYTWQRIHMFMVEKVEGPTGSS